jgi:hypothetical protein
MYQNTNAPQQWHQASHPLCTQATSKEDGSAASRDTILQQTRVHLSHEISLSNQVQRMHVYEAMRWVMFLHQRCCHYTPYAHSEPWSRLHLHVSTSPNGMWHLESR